jgi:hypothetical protein
MSFRHIALLSLIFLSLPGGAAAQTPLVAATGLRNPVKLVPTDGGNLVVTEQGNGPNTGRVSRVTLCGASLTLLSGLPAGPEPRGLPSGPSGIELQGNRLYIAIGAGDATVLGPVPPTEIPNPAGPSSPLLSSILQVDFSVDIDELQSGFVLSRASHDVLKSGAPVILLNAQGATATVSLLVDFPDFTDDPILIKRASNPFALALSGNLLYLADASQNAVIRIDLTTGIATRLATLAPLVNPLPLGPPRIDPVPDGIRFFNNRLLVTLLSGFPFPTGRAEVLSLDPVTGQVQSGLTGLTTAIDVFPLVTLNGGQEFYVLEHSTNQLATAPGRLLHFASATATPEVLTASLLAPTGFTRDPRSGDIFIAQIFAGQIVQIPGDLFDISLEDDETGDSLRFNSHTGEYLFVSCRTGRQLSGIGHVTRVGCRTRLRSARVNAQVEGCFGLKRGSATLDLPDLGASIFISDRNIGNNRIPGR